MRRRRGHFLEQERGTFAFAVYLSEALACHLEAARCGPRRWSTQFVTRAESEAPWRIIDAALLVRRPSPPIPAWLEEPRRLKEVEEEQTIFSILNRMLKEDLLQRAERARSRDHLPKRFQMARLRSRPISDDPVGVAQLADASPVSLIRGRPATRDTRRPCRNGFGFISRQGLLSS